MGHSDDGCRYPEGDPSSKNRDYSLVSDNFVAVDGGNALKGPRPMATEEKASAWGGHLRLGS